MPDRIHLTVASVVVRNDCFLMVRERSNGGLVYNQPAGHVEPGEKLFDAAVRETLEETAWHVEPYGILNLSTWQAANGITYHRVCFAARALNHDPGRGLDPDIESTHWLNYEQLLGQQATLRSPLVLQAVEDFRNNRIYPLDMIHE